MTTATWILAIATVALAAVTVATLLVTVRMARTDRIRDDNRRAEDRRRDDRLRREAADEWDRRTRAEQRAREDYEARQVTVEFTGTPPPAVIVSTPATYPIKQVGVDIVHWTGGNPGISPAGHAGVGPVTRDGRVRWTFPAKVSPHAEHPEVLLRFVDQHGNLYFNLKNHTVRFPQATEPLSAATQIDQWLRTGPKPDEPDPEG